MSELRFDAIRLLRSFRAFRLRLLVRLLQRLPVGRALLFREWSRGYTTGRFCERVLR